eukprot:8035267-Pyramimonas_sp.AAC.1
MEESDEELDRDAYVQRLAGDLVSKKMAEHRDELIKDLTAVVSSTVSEQVQSFASQLNEHAASASKLAEGVRMLPQMARDASEQFCSDKLDQFQRKFQAQLDGHTIRLRASERRLDEHDTVLQTLKEQIEELRGALALADKAPKPPPA